MTISSDQIQKRALNSSKILYHLHIHGPKRRLELAKQLKIRPNSIGNITDDLLQKNWIEFTNPKQPRSKIQLSSSGPYALAISTDANEINLAKVDLYGKILSIEMLSEAAITPEQFITKAKKAILKTINSDSRECLGCGVSISGIVNSLTGEVIRSIHFGPWENFPLRESLSQAVNLPILVENDMRCMAWSHTWFDHLPHNYQSVLFLGLGRGVSCATLEQGKLHRGAHHLAGEIGHIKSGNENRLCQCGKRDCLETYVSMDAMTKSAQCFNNKIQQEKDLIKAKRNPKVIRLIQETAKHLAQTLGPIMVANDPDAIILSSEEKEFGQTLIPHFKEQLKPYLLVDHPKILAFGERQKNELVGAAALIIEDLFMNRTNTL